MREINYSKIKKGLYSIEEDGRIYSHFNKRYMKTSIDKDGYLTISLRNNKNGYSRFGVHRLLLIAFNPIENMENMQVNHKDGNKLNNNLSNLEWVTCEENLKHARENNLNNIFGAKGEKHPNRRISEKEAKEIIKLNKEGYIKSEILIKVPNSTKNIINSIIHNRTWKHLKR